MKERNNEPLRQGTDPQQAEILSRRQAAAYLSVSDRTFDRIQKEAAIPFVMVRKRRKYILRDLETYLMSCRSV
jgi:excisionase family DNA binding protein